MLNSGSTPAESGNVLRASSPYLHGEDQSALPGHGDDVLQAALGSRPVPHIATPVIKWGRDSLFSGFEDFMRLTFVLHLRKVKRYTMRGNRLNRAVTMRSRGYSVFGHANEKSIKI